MKGMKRKHPPAEDQLVFPDLDPEFKRWSAIYVTDEATILEQYTKLQLLKIENQTEITRRVRKADREAKAFARLAKPPFLRVGRVAEFCFRKATYELVIQPRLSDAQIEYFDALQDRRIAKARWIRARDTAGICWLMFLQCGVSLAKHIVKLWKISGS